MTGELAQYQEWIGRKARCEDLIALDRAQAMAALLDLGLDLALGDPLPRLWHWLYFWEITERSKLGPDGHASRGEFLPPVRLARRMWAGSRLTFLGGIPIGARLCRRSTIKDVKGKIGKSGPLVFVTVEHRFEEEGEPYLIEEHDIVYRGLQTQPADRDQPKAAPRPSTWSERIEPDPVLLFRYSALTFNGHRIHYDQPYATQQEGYPGLVVHGPLIATYMLALAKRERPEREIGSFRFRMLSPLFDTAPFEVKGEPMPESDTIAVWTEGPGGMEAARGEVRFA